MKKSIIVFMALLPCATLYSCGKETAESSKPESNKPIEININDYVSAEFTGFETVGHYTLDIDFEKMVKDFPTAFGLQENQITKPEIEKVEKKFLQNIECGLSMENVLNGQEVPIEWNLESLEYVENIYNVDLITDEKTFTVAGLNKLTETDPFICIDVKFINGELEVSYKPENGFSVGTPEFIQDEESKKIEKFKKGDKVIFTAKVLDSTDLSEINQKIAKSGWKITSLEKEYICEE